MEASKRRRSMLEYRIQQLFKGSSKGSSIILEVPDEPKNNFGSSSTSLSESDDEVQDVYSDEENKSDAEVSEKQATGLTLTPHIDTVISMVTEKTTSTPTPPTTQAQVTNVSESDSSSKFKQRLSELEKKVEAMPKRAWTKKDQKWIDEMDKRDGLQTAYADNLTFSFCHANIEV
ncbi:hypothetical protein Tco_0302776 [Tanacetum coccineum]